MASIPSADERSDGSGGAPCPLNIGHTIAEGVARATSPSVTDGAKETAPSMGNLWKAHKEFSDGKMWLFWVGVVVSMCAGATMPLFAVAFTELQKILFKLESKVKFPENPEFADIDTDAESLKIIWFFGGMGLLMLIFWFLSFFVWLFYGNRVGINVRRAYFSLLMSQEVAYHDQHNSGSLGVTLTTHAMGLETAMGDKSGFGFMQFGTFVGGFVIAFYYSWEITLVLFATLPALILAGFIMGKVAGGAGKMTDIFAEGGALAMESLQQFQTVVAYQIKDSRVAQYTELLRTILPKADSRARLTGLAMGGMQFSMFGICYSVGLYYGATRIVAGELSGGDVFGAFFGFLMGGFGLGNMGSVAPEMAKGAIAATKLFELRNRKPQIRGPDVEGSCVDQKIAGEIEFKNVGFVYKSRPNEQVLKNLNLTIRPGQSCALVGPSGCGKSTIIKLIERFYDPTEGNILIDGVKIHNWSEGALRSQMCLVAQTPALFNTTIRENILCGMEASQQEIEAAARMANAHEFIMTLHDGYETKVGELGGLLSGGQRQRVAIARAMLRKPAILLLDEATSALDTESEREVQAAIDSISSKGDLTIIVIAHRLSTVKNCDQIAVVTNGQEGGNIIQLGTHDELIADEQGLYAAMVRAQGLTAIKSKRPSVVDHSSDA